MLEYFGYVVAAIIAGMFGYLSVLSSRESIISSLREKWLEAFREDSSQFLHVISKIKNNTRRLNSYFSEANDEEIDAGKMHSFFNKSYKDLINDSVELQVNNISDLTASYQRIKLRLLSREKDIGEMKEEDELENAFKEVIASSRMLTTKGMKSEENGKLKSSLNKNISLLESKLKLYISKEWARIKKGEKDIREKRRAVFIGVGVIVVIYSFMIISGGIISLASKNQNSNEKDTPKIIIIRN